MLNQNNTYEFAGKGAKRRRLHLEAEVRKIKSKPDDRKSEAATSERVREFRDVSGSEMKRAIRLLTLRTETHQDVTDALQRKGYSVTGITVSRVRSEMLEIVKLLIEEGLLDKRRLKERYPRARAR